MFYGLYIWNFSNPYLRDSSLKAHILILLCPFFSSVIFSYRARAGRGIAESQRWETFRPIRRASGTRTLSLLSFLGRSGFPGPCSQRTNRVGLVLKRSLFFSLWLAVGRTHPPLLVRCRLLATWRQAQWKLMFPTTA